jgi:RHS repeat-associated protein
LRIQGTDPVLATLLTAGNALIRRFENDPLYRPLSASGRECQDIPSPRPWSDDPRCGFNSGKHGMLNQDNAPGLTAIYREAYRYDPAGNLLSLHHSTAATAWARDFGMGGLTPQQWNQAWPDHVGISGEWTNPPGNRLTHVGDNNPTIPQSHFFDANGNLIQETTSRHCEWDQADRMRVYRIQTDGAEPSVHAHYLYDAGGQRVKKLVRKKGGQVEVTVYVDGIFEYHHSVQGNRTRDNDTLHVMDNQSRIALLRVGSPFPGDVSPAVKYHLGDHLGSSTVVIDATGAWINREEYFPYGETSFGSFAKKRYRYTGKERDEESGLYYYGARYYAPWLARWLSVDPIITDQGIYRSYAYVNNQPLVAIDPNGGHPLLIVVGVAILINLMVPNVANAPGPKDKLIPHVSEGEFAAQAAVSLASGGVGGAIGQQVALKTGSSVVGGGLAGGLGGVGSVAVNDIANQQLSSPSRYLQAGGWGVAIGTIGGVVGAVSGPGLRAPVGKTSSPPTPPTAPSNPAGLPNPFAGLTEAEIEAAVNAPNPFAGLTEAEIEAAVNAPASRNLMIKAPAPTGARYNISGGMMVNEHTVPATTSAAGATGDVATRIRVHTADPTAPRGSNSATGNTVTVTQGGGARRMTPDGTWHQTSTASSATMNESHIPIHRDR